MQKSEFFFIIFACFCFYVERSVRKKGRWRRHAWLLSSVMPLFMCVYGIGCLMSLDSRLDEPADRLSIWMESMIFILLGAFLSAQGFIHRKQIQGDFESGRR